jgi:hypothetical protein
MKKKEEDKLILAKNPLLITVRFNSKGKKNYYTVYEKNREYNNNIVFKIKM